MKLRDLIDFKKGTYKWEEILKVPEFAKLKETEQNPKWHAEGSVWAHTVNVCNEALKICDELDWISGGDRKKQILLGAALFHDVGKGETTTFTDTWHSYNHESVGEKIARRLLWDEELSIREDVCALVKYHMVLCLYRKSTHRAELLLDMSHKVHSLQMLLALCRCDLNGSVQEDLNRKSIDLMTVSEMEDFAKELNCYECPSLLPITGEKSASDEKRLFFENKPKKFVHVLIGLPGSGKSTWIKEHVTYGTILSRDAIRAELGFCKEGEKIVGTSEQENAVSEEFNKALLEKMKTDNVECIYIDNINLRRKYRNNFHTLLSDYNVVWKYFYFEADTIDKNINRRNGQIPSDKLLSMIETLDWPSPEEYDSLHIFLS